MNDEPRAPKSRQRMRIMVAIASYPHSNDVYLHRLLRAYRNMPEDADIVVPLNIAGALPPGVALAAGTCYIVTSDRIQRAIASGGYEAPPHDGKYHMWVRAATDVYTPRRLGKLIWHSRIVHFSCNHLTNRSIGRPGLAQSAADLPGRALPAIAEQPPNSIPTPTPVEPPLPGSRSTQSYHEARRHAVAAPIPTRARRPRSIRCKSGHTESFFAKRTMEVKAMAANLGRAGNRRDPA